MAPGQVLPGVGPRRCLPAPARLAGERALLPVTGGRPALPHPGLPAGAGLGARPTAERPLAERGGGGREAPPRRRAAAARAVEEAGAPRPLRSWRRLG